MKKGLIVLVLVSVFAMGMIVPLVNACTCNDGHGGSCSGNCCFYENGTYACLDFGHPGCPKAA